MACTFKELHHLGLFRLITIGRNITKRTQLQISQSLRCIRIHIQHDSQSLEKLATGIVFPDQHKNVP